MTHSIAYSGSVVSLVRSRFSRSVRARRRTRSPPGSTPPASQPRRTHSCMTCQIASSPALTSASGRLTHSLAIITPLMGSPVRWVWASSSAPLRKGSGTGVASGTIRGAPASSSPSTKPPPTE